MGSNSGCDYCIFSQCLARQYKEAGNITAEKNYFSVPQRAMKGLISTYSLPVHFYYLPFEDDGKLIEGLEKA